MDIYYVNKNTDNPGRHNEIHKVGCYWFPAKGNRTYLGKLSNCNDALKEAEKHYPNNVNGCKYCCYNCHKQ